MILHKSILIVCLIELRGKISDIYAKPCGSNEFGNKWGMHGNDKSTSAVQVGH